MGWEIRRRLMIHMRRLGRKCLANWCRMALRRSRHCRRSFGFLRQGSRRVFQIFKKTRPRNTLPQIMPLKTAPSSEPTASSRKRPNPNDGRDCAVEPPIKATGVGNYILIDATLVSISSALQKGRALQSPHR